MKATTSKKDKLKLSSKKNVGSWSWRERENLRVRFCKMPNTMMMKKKNRSAVGTRWNVYERMYTARCAWTRSHGWLYYATRSIFIKTKHSSSFVELVLCVYYFPTTQFDVSVILFSWKYKAFAQHNTIRKKTQQQQIRKTKRENSKEKVHPINKAGEWINADKDTFRFLFSYR